MIRMSLFTIIVLGHLWFLSFLVFRVLMDTKVLWKPSVSMTVRKDLCLAVQQGLSKCGTLKSQKVCCDFSAFMTFVKNWDIRENCRIKSYRIYLPTYHAITGWATYPKREHLLLIIGSGVLHVECHLSANQQCQSTEHNQTAYHAVLEALLSPLVCHCHLRVMSLCISWPPVYHDYHCLYMMATCISWPPVYHDHLYVMTTCMSWPPLCQYYHCLVPVYDGYLHIMTTCMSWPPVYNGYLYIMTTCVSWLPVWDDKLWCTFGQVMFLITLMTHVHFSRNQTLVMHLRKHAKNAINRWLYYLLIPLVLNSVLILDSCSRPS